MNQSCIPHQRTATTASTSDRSAWLKGHRHQCQTPPGKPAKEPHRIVLLGFARTETRPVISRLCEQLGICPLSISDVLQHIQNSDVAELSPAMLNALDFLKQGDAVPDETVLNMVSERLKCLQCSGGFVLEGFPHTLAQAKALDQLLDTHGLHLTSVLAAENPASTSTESGLREFYHKQDLLKSISKCGSPEDIVRSILQTLATV